MATACLSSVPVAVEPGSFRDRHGRVFYGRDTVFRALSSEALQEWEALSATRFFRRFMEDGRIVGTRRVDGVEFAGLCGQDWAAFLEHERIPFVTYPYEWSFSMLKEAALLQLDLLAAALEEGMILKDATPYNIQWVGSRPVFIDIPSFKRLERGETWIGYPQFCQLFLYPLLLQAYKGIPFHPWLRGSIDGITPECCNRLMSLRDLVRPGVLKDVYLQSKLQGGFNDTSWDVRGELFEAGFSTAMIQANVRRLRKLIGRLTWKCRRSQWSDYSENNSYTDVDRDVKEAFVRDAARSRRRRLVWDLGCNTGVYSQIAAENADYVVAMDADHMAVDRLYRDLRQHQSNSVLPLVNNLADPSPNIGWRNLERKRLPERGQPELALCLALIHHTTISANIPVGDFVDWLAGLGTELVIEFVTKDDPMVKKLLRNKEDQYHDYTLDFFESRLSRVFDVQRRQVLGCGTRVLYFARSRRAEATCSPPRTPAPTAVHQFSEQTHGNQT